MSKLCDALGIASKFTAHGSEVGELYDEGKRETIANYCEGDVISTTLSYAHCRAIEIGNAEYHASLTSQLVRWMYSEGHEHLLPFCKIEDLGGLLRQSLIAQIDAATRHAELSAALQVKRAIDASFGPTERY